MVRRLSISSVDGPPTELADGFGLEGTRLAGWRPAGFTPALRWVPGPASASRAAPGSAAPGGCHLAVTERPGGHTDRNGVTAA